MTMRFLKTAPIGVRISLWDGQKYDRADGSGKITLRRGEQLRVLDEKSGKEGYLVVLEVGRLSGQKNKKFFMRDDVVFKAFETGPLS